MAGAEHPEELKRTLLQFVSSELTAHAATVVGISVLLFTAVNVFTRENFLPAIHFPMQLVISKITFDYAVVFFCLLDAVRWIYVFIHAFNVLRGFS